MRSIVVSLALLVSVAVQSEVAPPMHVVPLTLSAESVLPLSSTIQFEISTNRIDNTLDAFTQWQHVSAVKTSTDQLVVTLQEQPQSLVPLSKKALQSSFVIDFDEPAVKVFVESYKAAYPQNNKQLSTLVSFVSQYISDPTYVHNFNIASKVVATQSGDCTEYAVLTAALARAIGIPARVVIGTVITQQGEEVSAFGHAWVEAWQSERWHTIDAALLGLNATRIFYLPAATLDNEGPGHMMSLVTAISQMPKRIESVKSLAL